MNMNGPIQWKISFQAESRTFVTDRCILLDQKVAFVDPLPPDGTDKKSEPLRIRNYERFHAYWALPACHAFSFSDLSVMESGHYAGPDKLVLNRKYISFLVRRIPTELLRFGMTGDCLSPVRLYRGEETVGLLMPIHVLPGFGPELIAMAESGDTLAQMQLGHLYSLGLDGIPLDYSEALKWYRQAAEQNHPAAFLWLGNMFVVGHGVEPDLKKALVLIEKAIELGHTPAIRWRSRLMRLMTPDQYRSVAVQIASQMATQDAPASNLNTRLRSSGVRKEN